ncbi:MULTISPECIES: TetR/AcrR family transcriptional regulator [unclassified Fusibacter]|uniref:TetR/AcrR family transcriptional regulator n=1 Tax=unclassified Fusibacter TaxID=2624464 RepID=UPI0010122248|nr:MULTISPECIES: TetR/AcrR family transcriptional regulator [unclassified Fusibacter]MCK8059905.1 TetR/AcrR family transcriptional regulator [Fusibacter sp. A2]NPE22047.1 TetR/AcrR family transcriptional regulator [Fusibacter sp. A1]RXV60828.1 TetR/AcrR family transcriptional regulator [Fusibacter sp. A1]
MKREEQKEESKMMIVNALLELMESEDYDRIKASDIIKKAGVGRMTFYRHFEDKDKVIYHYFSKYTIEQGKLLSKMKNASIGDLLLSHFQMMHSARHIDLLIKNNQLIPLLEEYSLMTMSFFEVVKETDLYKRMFNTAGIFKITEHWIKTGMKESAEEMTDIIMDLIEK